MTRAEIRRKAKAHAKTTKTLNMTPESLEKSLQEARNQERQKAIDYSVKHFTSALAIVLHDKWGFGHDTLKMALLQIGDAYDSICKGYLNDKDIRTTIFKETGLDLDKLITSKS